MAVALVSSPGRGDGTHWSHASAAHVATRLVAAGRAVTWLAAVAGRRPPPLPQAPSGVERRVLPLRTRVALHRVAACNRHLELELELTALLRRQPDCAVVHFGVGANGSPNVNWLADRLGSPAFAVVRAAEVLCLRGDLVHASGERCASFLEPERCRRCIASRWRRANAGAVRARNDLIAASLLASTAVFVADEADVDPLLAFGVPRRSLEVAPDLDVVAARIAR